MSGELSDNNFIKRNDSKLIDSSLPLHSLKTKKRKRKPYEELKSTQKRARVAEAKHLLQEMKVPVYALNQSASVPPAELIHLSTSDRKRIRSVKSLSIASEKQMILLKQELATTHGTGTATFSTGAFITDPIKLINIITATSPFICVGGDGGGGTTKLGTTYINIQNQQSFAPLLVYEGKNNWESLSKLKHPSLTPFIGDSSIHPHIFSVFQSIIDRHSYRQHVFLNGDWTFINNILGLMGANAIYPCPVCIVSKDNLLSTPLLRLSDDKHSIHRDHSPLLSIPPSRIVPLPLHLFLGISNKIIFECYSEMLGEKIIADAASRIRSTHTAGCGGLGDIHLMNGNELTRWIEQNTCQQVVRDAILQAATAAESLSTAPIDTISIPLLSNWMKLLHSSLLHSNEWTSSDILSFQSLVNEIWQCWEHATHTRPFPKLHMLHHALQFVKQYRLLGKVSEAKIESYHAIFNRKVNNNHNNQGNNTIEQLRRCLADTTLSIIQSNILT